MLTRHVILSYRALRRVLMVSNSVILSAREVDWVVEESNPREPLGMRHEAAI
jgi:hypothetical protein